MEVSYLICLIPKGSVSKTGGALDPDMTGSKTPSPPSGCETLG